MYVVTRDDLPPGVQACQAMHAALDFTFEHPEVASRWHRESNTIVLLTVSDELDLANLIADINCGDWRLRCTRPDGGLYRYTAFYEPDLGGELTAVAFEPAMAARLAHLPLALNGTERR